MAFSGNTGILDATGQVSKSTFKDDFLVPVANDIEALQGGAAIDFQGVSELLAVDAALDNKLLIRTDTATFFITAGEASKLFGVARPVLTKEDIDLVGDGVTDDAPAYQRACDFWSAAGGAVFMLRALPGQSFFFKGSPRGASNISTIFVSPHTVTKTARLTLQGQAASVANAGEFKLLVDTAAGDAFIRIDTSPHGGGNVSTHFAVGDILRLRGLRDSCGTALEEQEVRVTTITDGTARLDISPVLEFAFKVAYAAGDYEAAQGTANTSQVARLISARAASDIGAGDNLWPIAAGDIGKLVAGDVVLIHAENRCSDIGGSNATLTHVEMARIISSVPGDAAASLRLSRRVERDYTTAKFARLVKIDAIRNAVLSGASVEFTQAPEAGTFAHCYEVAYGLDCAIADCSVPNRDLFGTRGNSHRIFRSLACTIERPIARDAKYVDDGEGNGPVLAWATDCTVSGGTVAGMRHALQGLGATNCVFDGVTIQNPRHSPLDCHGAHEVGVRFVDCSASAATDYEADPGNAPVAINLGNPTLQAGSHRCGVQGGRFSGFKAVDGNHEPAIKVWPPSTNCFVRDVEFSRIGVLFGHTDISGSGTLVTSGLRIDGVSVDDWSGWLMDIDGRVNGASVNTLVDVQVNDLTARNGGRMIQMQFATEFQMYESEFDEITVDDSEQHVLKADSCPNLQVERCSFSRVGRGFRLTGCTDFRITHNTFADLTAGTVLHDVDGANTGIWQDNPVVGTTPTFNRVGGSVITESPRAAGVYVMEHETFIRFAPERKTGVCRVWSHLSSEVFAEFMFRCHGGEGGLEIVPDSETTTTNVDITTGELTGTTGVYDAFTISVTDGVIWFENQLGHEVLIDFSHS